MGVSPYGEPDRGLSGLGGREVARDLRQEKLQVYNSARRNYATPLSVVRQMASFQESNAAPRRRADAGSTRRLSGAHYREADNQLW